MADETPDPVTPETDRRSLPVCMNCLTNQHRKCPGKKVCACGQCFPTLPSEPTVTLETPPLLTMTPEALTAIEQRVREEASDRYAACRGDRALLISEVRAQMALVDLFQADRDVLHKIGNMPVVAACVGPDIPDIAAAVERVIDRLAARADAEAAACTQAEEDGRRCDRCDQLSQDDELICVDCVGEVLERHADALRQELKGSDREFIRQKFEEGQREGKQSDPCACPYEAASLAGIWWQHGFDLVALRQRVQALETFAAHKGMCAKGRPFGYGECSCGLDQLLATPPSGATTT